MAKLIHRFETLRPDELRQAVSAAPIAYWPLGLLEHHGWHLPVGYDGIKADRLAVRMAERTGGLILPTMWWGALGGHQDFAWTLYQDPAAAGRIVADTCRRLPAMGFRAIVLLAGHYPWQQILDAAMPPIVAEHPESLFLYGTEASIAGDLGAPLEGDHAARWETAYGLALLPELVRMEALEPHESADWPDENKRPDPTVWPDAMINPRHPLFGQFGEDPRNLSDGTEGTALLDKVCDAVASRIHTHITNASSS
jgi:creatinine amidohydrolase